MGFMYLEILSDEDKKNMFRDCQKVEPHKASGKSTELMRGSSTDLRFPTGTKSQGGNLVAVVLVLDDDSQNLTDG